MNPPKINVKIFGAPVAGCKPGNTWKDAANLAKNRLFLKFGEQIEVEYIEFLPPKWKDFPEIAELINKKNAKIPIVTVNNEVISCGGKLNISQIEKHLLSMGVKRYD